MHKLNLPALPLSGGCPCEAVRFLVKAMPLLIYACSLPGMPAMVRQRLQHVDAGFGGCGGRVYGQRSGRPDVVSVRAGTLDDTSWVRPIAHVYMSSAQPWERIPNRGECFDTMPGDFWALARKWQELWDAA